MTKNQFIGFTLLAASVVTVLLNINAYQAFKAQIHISRKAGEGK